VRVAVLDTGVGNVHSLLKALAKAGGDPTLTLRERDIRDAPLVVLPGVGAFPAAVARLEPLRAALRERLTRGGWGLGICLGMQLFLDESEEGPGRGLGVIPGQVQRLRAARVPHMGWNAVEGVDPLLVRSGLRTAYFAHGYVCRPRERKATAATTEHAGVRFPAMIRCGTAVGVQFHPEKSGAPGLGFLAAVLEEVRT
jgi:glutamine amidotransferase